MTQGWILLADELKLTTAEELETWLQDKPTEWGYVIGIRSALRILPFVGHVYQFDNLKSTDLDQLILTTFRVCLLPLAA